MELKEDGKLPFLDCLLERGCDGMLTSTVYRKPTHTDRYLHFKSHHPSHVKRGIVRCLYQRARRVTNMSENLKKEEKHLYKVLQSNGHDNAIIRAGSKELPSRNYTDDKQEKGLILSIPYIAGVSESIKRVCRDFDIKTAFKSGRTLRSHLTKVKDTIPISSESSIVYSIPCSCGKVYIGETTRRLEQRVKEHQDACRKGDEKISAIAEHAWQQHHPIKWEEVRVLDRASRKRELKIKEALHIQMTPDPDKFNRDVGLELPGCWLSMLRVNNPSGYNKK